MLSGNKIKRFIFVFLLLFSISGFTTNWQKLATDYNGNSVYIDIDDIKTNKGRVHYSSLIDFLKPKRESFSVVSKYKIDCGEEQITWLSTTYYDQSMGNGKITFKSSVKQIRLPQTDLLARTELLFICEYDNSNSQ